MNPEIFTTFPIVDEIIAAHAAALGRDAAAYRNHVYRMLNFYHALSPEIRAISTSVEVAAAFHDLGIWTHRTFDYLFPSCNLATDYLNQNSRADLAAEVENMILHHHKITTYTGENAAHVERFRRADLVDLSLGTIRFGIPRATVKATRAAFPNAGFHRRLASLTIARFARHPLNPLPMFRW